MVTRNVHIFFSPVTVSAMWCEASYDAHAYLYLFSRICVCRFKDRGNEQREGAKTVGRGEGSPFFILQSLHLSSRARILVWIMHVFEVRIYFLRAYEDNEKLCLLSCGKMGGSLCIVI